MKKRVYAMVVCVFMSLFTLFACVSDPKVTYAELKADEINSYIYDAIDWFKGYYDLDNNADLSELPVIEDNDYSASGKALVSNSIRVLTLAKKIGYNADYDAYYNKLELAFKTIYGEGVAGENNDNLEFAYSASINVVIKFLLKIGKNPTSFCGYDLLDLHVYGNSGFEYDPYVCSYALITYKQVLSTINATYTTDDLISFLVSLQTDDGFFGYEDFYGGGFINDTDYTALAAYALSLYNTELAQTALNKAKTALLTFKNENGTYKSAWSDSSSSSTALALTLFAQTKDDVFKNAIEEEVDPLTSLWLFKNEDGGFAAGEVTESEMPSDMYSTIDAMDAMFGTLNYYLD